MAKKSSVNRNKKRISLNLKFANKRRKLKISRISLRQLSLEGKVPGMVKSSW